MIKNAVTGRQSKTKGEQGTRLVAALRGAAVKKGAVNLRRFRLCNYFLPAWYKGRWRPNAERGESLGMKQKGSARGALYFRRRVGALLSEWGGSERRHGSTGAGNDGAAGFNRLRRELGTAGRGGSGRREAGLGEKLERTVQSYAENAAKKSGEARLNKGKRDKRRRKKKRAGNGGKVRAEKQARGRNTTEQMERRIMEERHGKR